MSTSFPAGAEVLASLDREVREGIRVLPRRGLEVGGLLIGKLAPGVEIAAVRMVAIEHRFGPSFVLSEADMETFRKEIREVSAEGEVIGHFRSQTKGTPGTTEADDRIADLIGIPNPVLVVVPVSDGEPCPAQLYQGNGGAWRQVGEPEPARAPISAPAPVPVAVPVAVRPRAMRLGLGWRIALVAAGFSICGAVFHLGYRRQQPAEPAVPAQEAGEARIGLTVSRGSGALVISWDAASPVIRSAESGMLFVSDGDVRREVELSRDLLREGKVFYMPQSPVVEFRLQVYRDRLHYVAEGLKIDTGLPPTAPARLAEPAIQRAATPTVQPAGTADRAISRRQFVSPAELARSVPRAGHVEELPVPPPDVARAPATTPRPLPDILGPAPAAAPAPPEVSYVAAAPLRRVRAAIPPHLRSAIKTPTSVEVKVSIDESGKVVNAIPVGSSSFEGKLLAPQATQAALLWTFSPARMNGRPQSSELMLTFTFDRQ